MIDKTCACYYCFSEFKESQIRETTDNGATAICPACSVDAVIVDCCGNDTRLKNLNDRFFSLIR